MTLHGFVVLVYETKKISSSLREICEETYFDANSSVQVSHFSRAFRVSVKIKRLIRFRVAKTSCALPLTNLKVPP